MTDINFDMKELRDFGGALKKIDTNGMCRDAVAQLGATYIASAKRNTPVGGTRSVVFKLKNGQSRRVTTSSEHMRRSWQLGRVETAGSKYSVKVSNTASYATFVDSGHRQTPGRFVPILGKKLVANYVQGLKITEKAEKTTNLAMGGIFSSLIGKHTKGV